MILKEIKYNLHHDEVQYTVERVFRESEKGFYMKVAVTELHHENIPI